MAPLRVLPVVALLALSGVTAAAGQSPPTGLECGDTITADTTLDRDLTNCPSNGIIIGADDITLDLNGHSISGDGKPVRRCPRRQPCDMGVFNDRHNGVTVRNGSLRGFAVGVLLGGVRGNRLEELSSSRNQVFGYVIADSSRSTVRDSSGNDNLEPEGTAWACLARMTCGSSATRFAATVNSACTSRTRQETSSRATRSWAMATSGSCSKATAISCGGIASLETAWRPSRSVPAAGM